jgi:hypothetical protein
VLYFLNSETFYWCLVSVAGLLGLAFGTSLSLPTKDRRAGRGARHRKPGLASPLRGDGPATVTGVARAERRTLVSA